jgi:hypothetical protein
VGIKTFSNMLMYLVMNSFQAALVPFNQIFDRLIDF